MPKHKSIKPNDTFVEDVELLLEKAVVEEATQAVWQAFEAILEKLDPQSQNLIAQHFEGKSVQEISANENLPEKDLEVFLKRLKQEVAENLRRGSSVRQ